MQTAHTAQLAAGISLFCLLSGPVFSDNISPTNSNIRYVGRFNTADPAAPRMYWSGTHLMAWFEGTSCQVKLNCSGGDGFFNIVIDDGAPVKHALIAGSQTIDAASGLSNAIHKIEIFKRTSYIHDNTAFEGFITDTGKGLVAPPPAPSVKIQFYGDSITDGYDVDGLSNSEVATYWNNYLTYAARTARNLNMQYVSTAATGIAVLHPWRANFIMDHYYDRIVPAEPVDHSSTNQWDFAQYVPEIVVVNLFQNDAWVNPSPHTDTEQDAIITAYENLLVKIRAAHPDAEMICALGNMDATAGGSIWPGYITNAVARMQTIHGDQKIDTLFFPHITSNFNHPSAEQHVPMADALTAHIQTHLGYLFDIDGDGQSNDEEIALGTNPDDPTSFFGLTQDPTLFPSGKILLSWPSHPGVRYRLWESSDLKNWILGTGWMEADTPPLDIIERELTPSNNYFKIEAEIL